VVPHSRDHIMAWRPTMHKQRIVRYQQLLIRRNDPNLRVTYALVATISGA